MPRSRVITAATPGGMCDKLSHHRSGPKMDVEGWGASPKRVTAQGQQYGAGPMGYRWSVSVCGLLCMHMYVHACVSACAVSVWVYACVHVCLSLSQRFYSCMKHHDQEASWGGKGLFSLHFHIAVHHQRESGLEFKQVRKQELMQRPWRDVPYWLASPGLLACFLIEPKTTSPKMASPTRDPPALIINWENALQLYLMEALPQLKLLPLW